MQQKPLKHTGDKTSPVQQRINRANSLAALSRLLELNFPMGARMLTLGYEPAEYAPVGEFAEADICAWVRRVRARLGGSFQYVRVTAHGQASETATVHRIVTVCPEYTAYALAEIWTYGPITVDEIGAGELSALAGQLAANAAAPNRKTWVSSKGLKRS